MSTTLQRADTSVAPDAGARHSIAPLLIVVLMAAVLWIAALSIRRRRTARQSAAGRRDRMPDR
jgi:hypothetical protein